MVWLRGGTLKSNMRHVIWVHLISLKNSLNFTQKFTQKSHKFPVLPSCFQIPCTGSMYFDIIAILIPENCIYAQPGINIQMNGMKRDNGTFLNE